MNDSIRKFILGLCATSALAMVCATPRAETTAGAYSTQKSNAQMSSDSKMGAGLNRTSKIIGTDVLDKDGKKIEEIKDVVLDRARGQVAYAVVSFGGVMGVGSKYFAIPWKALQASTGDKYALNVDKEMLKNAPGFDKNHWPDMASVQWNNDIHRFYQQTPYWQHSSGSSD